MISDEYVRQLFQNCRAILAKHRDPKIRLPKQFYRGVVGTYAWEGQHPGGCNRHLSVFEKFNIIPRYCFNCYKILFEPRTVVELFKLMVVFEKLDLPCDNTRKCYVETREQVSGTYKGYIYCQSIEEGKEILKMVQRIVSKEISEKIPTTLKRGCSEYPLAYPEYAQMGQGKTAMKYNEEWQVYEDLFDREFVVKEKLTTSASHNRPRYTLYDARVMLCWLRYAVTIGDVSYMKISGMTLQPFQGIERSSPFHLIADE